GSSLVLFLMLYFISLVLLFIFVVLMTQEVMSIFLRSYYECYFTLLIHLLFYFINTYMLYNIIIIFWILFGLDGGFLALILAVDRAREGIHNLCYTKEVYGAHLHNFVEGHLYVGVPILYF
ncbi:hypothetical protein ACJX0J_022340, partial [Zea mays]